MKSSNKAIPYSMKRFVSYTHLFFLYWIGRKSIQVLGWEITKMINLGNCSLKSNSCQRSNPFLWPSS